MVFTYPLILKTSSAFINPLWIVLNSLTTTGIITSSMYNSFFFISLARSMYLSLFAFFYILTLWSAGMAKSSIRQVPFLWLTVSRFNRLAEIRWSLWITKSQRSFCVSFSRDRFCVVHTHSLAWSNQMFCTTYSRLPSRRICV